MTIKTREMLEKQLELLSERSQNENEPENLEKLTHAMVEIAKCIYYC